MGEHGIPVDSEAGRKEFARYMEGRRAEEQAANHGQIRRGWMLGSEVFRAELLAAVAGTAGPSHFATDRNESDEQKARRIVADGLKLLGWKEEELPRKPKGDPGKVSLAQHLRSETTMSLKWVAEQLHMGSWTYVSNLLAQRNTSKLVSIVRTDT